MSLVVMFHPVKMEEEGWSKNNGIVWRLQKPSIELQRWLCSALALFFPSYFLFFRILSRSLDKTQMCCPKEKGASIYDVRTRGGEGGPGK